MPQDTQFIQPLHRMLSEIGLSELEIKLYILSVTSGPLLVSRIATNLGISRPNVYKVIAGLEKYGLARFSDNKGYNRRFIAEAPSRAMEIFREKQKQLRNYDQEVAVFMPELMASYQQGQLPTKIKIIQNREQLMAVFEQVFEEAKDEIYFVGSTADLNKLVTFANLEKNIKRRIERGVRAKILVFHDTEADILKQRDGKELRETRFMRTVKPFIPSFYIFANKVIIWQPKAPLAILIEDQYIVDMQKNIFAWLWEDTSTIQRSSQEEDKNLILASRVVSALKEKDLHISMIESCTGGALANAITNIVGASDVLADSFVAYSNSSKIALGIPEDVIARCTVYSEEVARAMAEAVLARSVHANVGVGITGSISRPDPNNQNSVPGTIYIAVKYKNKIVSKKLEIISNHRINVKQKIVTDVLEMILQIIADE